MDAQLARVVWHHLETVNAVMYFAPECREAPASIGLTGFWMGYFACRAAPMGPVGPGVVEATFYNFHPERVRRAIPDAWTYSSPASLLELRSTTTASALRRVLTPDTAERLAGDISPSLSTALAHATPEGKPLFGANLDVALPGDPVAALWQQATTLREHRGDIHVALLVEAGLDGCEVHVLFAATEGVDPGLLQRGRGWSEDDWAAAVERLAARGFVTREGAITSSGRQLRTSIERRTDELSIAPYRRLGDDGVEELLRSLRSPVETIIATGELRFPNPMGLPPAQRSRR